MKRKKFLGKKNSFYNKQEGYTIVEILLITLVIGLTYSISLPLFGAVINKTRQKEATLIVNSVLKAAKANYALEAFLPTKIKSLEKFSSFHKCIAEEVSIKGREVCDLNTIAKTQANDEYFYSPSGNYKVELKTTTINNSDTIFQVRAIPNGVRYLDKGSSVTGCFNPIGGISSIKEYSFLNVGEKEFMSCFSALQTNKAEETRKASEAKKAEEARNAAEAKKAAEERKAAEAKKAEEARKAAGAKPKCIYLNPRNPSQCFRYE